MFYNKVLLGVFIVGLLSISGCSYDVSTSVDLNEEELRVCTQEAKICPGGSTVSRVGPNCEFAQCPTVSVFSGDGIEIDSFDRTSVTNGMKITGTARTWYFEASFPVYIEKEDGTVLATLIAQAQDDWMVDAYVPFEVTLDFDIAEETAAIIVFTEEDVSGLGNTRIHGIPVTLQVE